MVSEERVDERAPAGVALSNDDDQEEIVELADRRGEASAVLTRRANSMSVSRRVASSSRGLRELGFEGGFEKREARRQPARPRRSRILVWRFSQCQSVPLGSLSPLTTA
jgi:hypothetical protein